MDTRRRNRGKKLPCRNFGSLDLRCVNRGVVEQDSVVYRDLFDTELMGVLTPRPSQVRKRFAGLREHSPREATDWFYQFSQDTNYIRRDRIAKDVQWKADTEYGQLDITINLSKPEKDPRAIAAAKIFRPGIIPGVFCAGKMRVMPDA